ncbi:MAG: efflux transporter outer membrane subunit [Chitinivibrionales bacterium]|nr:efflux transporter outer membrane subunit [Chitinivibrionales bacterium]
MHYLLIRRALILVSLLALILNTCVGPRYHTRVDEFVSFTSVYDTIRLEASPKFWIEQPELDSLLSAAFNRNPDMLVAWARVEQAKAAAVIATAPLFPSVSASGQSFRTKLSDFTFGGGPITGGQPGGTPIGGGAGTTPFTDGIDNNIFTQYQTSLAASYEVDLFTRLIRRRQAAVKEAMAAQADARAMSITLAAQVTDTWLMLVAQRQTIDLLESQLENSKRFGELTELRFAYGQASALSVIQQEQQIERLRGQLGLARARAATLKHQLDVLLGYPPTAATAVDTRTLPDAPEVPITGVPADLFKHRPDVCAAWLRLKASDAEAAAAILDFFPSINLSASLFTDAEEINNLFDELLWSLSGTITQPIFQGRRLIAGVRRARAAAEADYYTYINTTLTALREVRDALVLIRGQETWVNSLKQQVEDAEIRLDLSRERYMQGVESYLQVLTALNSLQSTQQTLVEAIRQLLSYHVQLYRAVGGSYPELAGDYPTEKEPEDE